VYFFQLSPFVVLRVRLGRPSLVGPQLLRLQIPSPVCIIAKV
jgi:hypothetical protein